MAEQIFKIELGTEVKDIVTGMRGIVVARLEFLNRCIQYDVQPKKKPGDKERPKGLWVDEQQLEVISSGVSKKIAKQFETPKPSTHDQPTAPVRTGGGFRRHPGE